SCGGVESPWHEQAPPPGFPSQQRGWPLRQLQRPPLRWQHPPPTATTVPSALRHGPTSAVAAGSGAGTGGGLEAVPKTGSGREMDRARAPEIIVASKARFKSFPPRPPVR